MTPLDFDDEWRVERDPEETLTEIARAEGYEAGFALPGRVASNPYQFWTNYEQHRAWIEGHKDARATRLILLVCGGGVLVLLFV